ncbi:hypothetical protein MSG28_011812 [Choristoneura fumiferana]|uniref:Uncharacterized protein n=1 Tax=Choristoneura fumiferana TaxID=7141 RepID=A0ACC0KME8_CHOFU|nr:hypothetical protein MSG28_011812 [Choristoneura fumiferana]
MRSFLKTFLLAVLLADTANPSTIWQTTIQPQFNHVVHFGGKLSPSVRGSGNVVSCHMVTPNNEDLFVTRESEYPDIRLVQDTDSACSIAIEPITQSHLGSWVIYGKFNSALWGYNEVRLPMILDLYDKNNPYEQSYNVTNLNPIQHVVNLGSTISVEVASTGAVDVCLFTMPSGMSYNTIDHGMPAGVSFVNDNRIACRLSIGPITQDMLGTWVLNGKFSNRDIYTERIQGFTIIQEDPSNPIQEEDRNIEYLPEQFIDTDIGASERVVITQPFLNTIQSCHIRTPEGLQYTFMEGFDIPGIKIVTGSNVQCGVNVEVSEGIIGDWTLIAREIRSSERIERRLPFKIYVEEFVDASPNEITITEGNALHVRLMNPTYLHETCKLLGPDNEPSPLTSSDERYDDTCGFVVTSVDAQHNGTWHIVYGTKIIYKAPVIVNVNARSQQDDFQLSWLEYSSVSQIIGPEDAVYCRVISPKEVVVFDDFGRCRVDVDNVLFDLHAGVWVMMVGLPGRIVTERHTFYVDVKAEDKKPEVTTSVWQDKPIVELTCALKSAEEKTGCLFRNPLGNVLVASQGVREDRYAFHVNQTRSASDEFYYSCGLQITDPVTSDLGLWRCDLESEDDIYFGFLSVLCPWAMRDPEVAASVIAEPVLTPVVSTVSVAELEPVVLACSARAPLRYCYFRAANGTVYNVRPGSSAASAEYAGAGLDAGECGMRVDSLTTRDAGTWSCHAGFHNAPEQSHRIAVFVYEEFVVSSSRESAGLVVEGQVSGHQQLEYCRFVRVDGFGFTSDNPPSPYVDESVLSEGLCRIRVAHSLADLHAWTVVAKIQGRGEISRVTGYNWPDPPVFTYNSLYMWLPFLVILMFTLALAAAFAPAKNRRWAAERTSSLRRSLLRFSSIQKKPLPHEQTNPAA